MATFITAQSVGSNINISVETSTGHWKYNHDGVDSSVFSNGSRTITVANANGEFTIIPCLSDGTPSGDLTNLDLSENQLTSFDGTGLTSLTNLYLQSNQLTSFDGTGLTSLTNLVLNGNQLTSFDGTGLSSLTSLALESNQLTSFDGTDLSSLTSLGLYNNQITSFDGTDLTSLTSLSLNGNQLTSFDITGLNILQYLYIDNNPFTNPTSTNNSLLAKLAANELANNWYYGEFSTTGGRTSAGTTDYDYLIANGWNVSGADITSNPTFITSKAVGNNIQVYAQTSTGYWKYNHNGSDSGVFSDESTRYILIQNANGEFTIIPCLEDGTPSGDITTLDLSNNQITSFDGTGLTSLTNLNLNNNQLTSLDGFILPTSLTALNLGENQITSFDGTGLTSLTNLGLQNNQLTSFDGTDLSSLTYLDLNNNQLTSFDGTGLTSLTNLILGSNQLTSFDGTGLDVLQYLYINNNPFTNPTSTNNSLLAKLAANELANTWGYGEFSTTGGRTSAGTTDYNYLIANGWLIEGADIVEETTTTTTTTAGSGNVTFNSVSLGGTRTDNYLGPNGLPLFLRDMNVTLNNISGTLSNSQGISLVSDVSYIPSPKSITIDGVVWYPLIFPGINDEIPFDDHVNLNLDGDCSFIVGVGGDNSLSSMIDSIPDQEVFKLMYIDESSEDDGYAVLSTQSFTWGQLKYVAPTGNGKLRIKGVNSGGGGFPSDVTFKTNVIKNGVSDSGINIYQFQYVNDIATYTDIINTIDTYQGVIAQELIGTEFEDALVLDENGKYLVDYSKIDVEFKKLN